MSTAALRPPSTQPPGSPLPPTTPSSNQQFASHQTPPTPSSLPISLSRAGTGLQIPTTAGSGAEVEPVSAVGTRDGETFVTQRGGKM